MTKGKELFFGAKKQLDDLVSKIKKSFGDTERVLLETLKEKYTEFRKKGYNIVYYEFFYKKVSENRRKLRIERFKEMGEENDLFYR